MRADLSIENFRGALPAQVRAVSFDVFDTVVTRTFARPADLFVELGSRLLAQGLVGLSPARFGRLRVLAEAEACGRRDDHETNLSEIMECLGQRLGWQAPARAHALAAELALEREAIRPVTPILAWIAEARRAQKKIVFVSDMYLSSEFLRELLVAHAIAQPDDPIFVSNEHRASKSAGTIFPRVAEALKISPSELLHIGDNEHSDVAMARKAGLQARQITTTLLGAIERSYLPFGPDLDGLSAQIAAAARLGRINSSLAASDQALCEIGAGLLGPLLTAFVLWSFHRARQAGLRRLYFVSRDGQVIREIALALQARMPMFADFDCRYLYGSRIAWHHASLTALTPRHLRWLLNPQPIVHAGILAHRLGVEQEVLTRCLQATAASHLLAKQSWDANDLALLTEILPHCGDELLSAAGAPARVQLARAYLTQEGLFDGTPWGVVELGWSGSMLTSLCEALGHPARLDAFYLCQTHEDPDLPAAVRLESFLMKPEGAQPVFVRHLRLAEMIEAITAADHPTVLGYQKNGSSIGPRLKKNTIPMWTPAALASLRGGASGFLQAIDTGTLESLRATTAVPIAACCLAFHLLSVLSRFAVEPTRELATPFTRCSFSEDPADEHRRNFAEPLNLWTALSDKPFRADELWREGSLVCSSGTAQALVRGGLPNAFRHLKNRLSPS
ncbi:MAG: HAD-IA family hydrolase [Opitutaceae bacterium]